MGETGNYDRSFISFLSDYSEVTGLLAEVFSEECYRDTMEAFANQLSWDSELVMVAERNNKVVGVIIGT